MFPARYFAPRYFAARYWPKVGATPSAPSYIPGILIGDIRIKQDMKFVGPVRLKNNEASPPKIEVRTL